MKLLSIIVPVYNTEKWLCKCLDSLHGINTEQYEVVVVDDASKDASLALAKQYAAGHANFRILEMGANSGLCAVRNAGIAHARGEHVMFVDSDDYLVPGAVDEILSTLQTADADIIRFRLKRVSVSGMTLVVQSRSAPGRFDIQTEELRTTSTLREVYNTFCLNTMGGNAIFRRSLMRGLEYDRKYTPSEDRVFGAECFLRARTFYVTHGVWYCYVQHSSGLSRNYPVEQVRSLLDIQLALLEKSREWPWFTRVQKIAYSKILGVYLGWDYELVFHDNRGNEALKVHYFNVLGQILDSASIDQYSLTKRRMLRLFVDRKSKLGLLIYRIPATSRRKFLTATHRIVSKWRDRTRRR